MPAGYLVLILHAHLPYVKHTEREYTLEEDWLYEAITETYIPLLLIMEGWENDGVPYRLTMSITPTLAAMLEDDLLCHRYRRYLANLEDLAAKEVARTGHHPHVHRLARMYLERFRTVAAVWDRYRGRILNGFRRLQDTGRLEIVASGATHGYLPLMTATPEMARAQVRIGAEAYRRAFARNPRGFWLPECGYFPGHDRWLAEEGIRYTFVDGHGLLHASRRPRYGVYAPLISPAGVAFFGRDGESSKQVWSMDEGYPGDFDYREFYRDVGFDLPWETIAPNLPHGLRTNTGIKYHRITGKTEHKELYDPERAKSKAYLHAANFVFNRERQSEYLRSIMDRPPVIVAPYDAELFGHWWFEGPYFLDGVVRRLAETPVVDMITAGEYLSAFPVNQHAEPSQSSWGLNGYSEVWLDGCNDWIYRHLAPASDKLLDLVLRFRESEGLARRALNQAARELLLAQSSDWAFIMKTGTTVAYAERRTKEHLASFLQLYDMLVNGTVDAGWLAFREETAGIFPWLEAAEFFAPLPESERQVISVG